MTGLSTFSLVVWVCFPIQKNIIGPIVHKSPYFPEYTAPFVEVSPKTNSSAGPPIFLLGLLSSP
jgi:hypothetical protein